MIPLGLHEFHGYQLTSPPQERAGGVTLIGEHPGGSRPVLIRLAELPDGPDRIDRIQAFLSDVEQMRGLSDASFLHIEEVGEEAGHAYSVHAAPAGPSLRPFLRRSERLPLPCILQAMAQAAWALHRAHEAGVVHLALSPDNVFLHPSGAVICDYGFHHLRASGIRLHAVGEAAHSPLDPRADVYDLGLLLYHLSTGVHPLAKGGRKAGKRRGYIAPAIWWDPGLPQGLSEICERALAEDPGDRFPSAGAMAMALEALPELADGPVDWPDLTESMIEQQRAWWLSGEVAVTQEESSRLQEAGEDGGRGSKKLNLALEPLSSGRLPKDAGDGEQRLISWRSLKSFPVPITEGAITLDLHHDGRRPDSAPPKGGQLAQILPWRPREEDASSQAKEQPLLDEALDDLETSAQAIAAPVEAINTQAAGGPTDSAERARRPAPQAEPVYNDGSTPPLKVASAGGPRPLPLMLIPPPVGEWALGVNGSTGDSSLAALDYGAAAGAVVAVPTEASRQSQRRLVTTTILATLLFSIPVQHVVTTRFLDGEPTAQIASVDPQPAVASQAAPIVAAKKADEPAAITSQALIQLPVISGADASLTSLEDPQPALIKAPAEAVPAVTQDSAPLAVAALPKAKAGPTAQALAPPLTREAKTPIKAPSSQPSIKPQPAPRPPTQARKAPAPKAKAAPAAQAERPSTGPHVAPSTAAAPKPAPTARQPPPAAKPAPEAKPAAAAVPEFRPPGARAAAAPAPSMKPADGPPTSTRASGGIIATLSAPQPPSPSLDGPPIIATVQPTTLGAAVSDRKPAAEMIAARPAEPAKPSLKHPQPSTERTHPTMVLNAEGVTGALVTLWWRTEAGPFSRTSMTPAGGGTFTTRLPASAGSRVEYFFEALDENGLRTTLREGNPYVIVLPAPVEEAPAEPEGRRRRFR